MTVQKYIPPTQSIDTFPEYKNNIDASIRVLAQLAANFAPRESDTPAMTVTIEAGKLMNGATFVSQALQTTTTITAPVTNPRIDRVYINTTTGAFGIITGAENVSPVAPAHSANQFPVCQIALVLSQTTILNADITDERPQINLDGSGTVYNITDNSDANWLTVSVGEEAEFSGSVKVKSTGFKGIIADERTDAATYSGVIGLNSGAAKAYQFQNLNGTLELYYAGTIGGNLGTRTMYWGTNGTTGFEKLVYFNDTVYLQDNILDGAKLKDYSVSHSAPTSSSGAITFDYATSNSFAVTLTENITTITLSTPPASGSYGEIVIEFLQNATGGWTVTWPASVKWPGGTAPVITTTATTGKDKVFLSTRDGGTTWLGEFAQDYS